MKNKAIKTAALTAALVTAAAGCGEKTENENKKTDPAADISYITEKGTLTVGITDLAPLNYMDGASESGWSGFDAELTTMFADKLGVSVEFMEINWEDKVKLLENGDIDLIWNGMTKTEDLEKSITCSSTYLLNSQVIVLKKSDLDRYKSGDECENLLFACERGSSGKQTLESRKYRTFDCDSQLDALEAITAGKADAAVVDMIMAAYLTGDKAEYPDLSFAFPLNEEDICVGMRKGSDLEEKVNAFLNDIFADGTIYTVADKYDLRRALAGQQE